jgi:hypothetical protein
VNVNPPRPLPLEDMTGTLSRVSSGQMLSSKRTRVVVLSKGFIKMSAATARLLFD